jgi:hypothetical protein
VNKNTSAVRRGTADISFGRAVQNYIFRMTKQLHIKANNKKATNS